MACPAVFLGLFVCSPFIFLVVFTQWQKHFFRNKYPVLEYQFLTEVRKMLKPDDKLLAHYGYTPFVAASEKNVYIKTETGIDVVPYGCIVTAKTRVNNHRVCFFLGAVGARHYTIYRYKQTRQHFEAITAIIKIKHEQTLNPD